MKTLCKLLNLTCMALMLGFVFTAGLQAQTWSPLGDGTDGIVRAIAVYGNDVYVGGEFTTAGGKDASNIAKWGGSSWSALGSGSVIPISSIVIDNSGIIYAAGYQLTAFGSECWVAKWDETENKWHSLANQYSTVTTLKFDGGDNLYGAFSSTTTGPSINTIAKLSGNSWLAVVSGASIPLSAVYAIAFDRGDNLYVGGYSGTALNGLVAKKEKSSSSFLPVGSEMDGLVFNIVFDGEGTPYASGRFTSVGGETVNHIVKWVDNKWSALGKGTDTQVLALIAGVNNNDVYAGGDFVTVDGQVVGNIVKWNGSEWSALGSGVSGSVQALAIDDEGSVYVGGLFTKAGGEDANRIAKFTPATPEASEPEQIVAAHAESDSPETAEAESDAADLDTPETAKTETSAADLGCDVVGEWVTLGSGANKAVRDIAIDNDGTVYAVGDFTQMGEVTVNYVAKWKDGKWESLGNGIEISSQPPFSQVWFYCVAVDDDGNVYVGGQFTHTIGDITLNSIAKWDGEKWSDLNGGITSPGRSRKVASTVHDLVIDSQNNLYVAGQFEKAGMSTIGNIAKWNGEKWSALGTGIDARSVKALSLDRSNNLYAGCDYIKDGKPAGYIAKWGNGKWEQLSSTQSLYPHALVIDRDGNLYVGGSIPASGDVLGRLAKWANGEWTEFGGELNQIVQTLVVDGSNNLYIGGDFGTAGGKIVPHIAKWTGSGWEAVGGGLNGSVSSIAIHKGVAYAGGDFSSLRDATQPDFIAKFCPATPEAPGTEEVVAEATDSDNPETDKTETGGGDLGYDIAGGKDRIWMCGPNKISLWERWYDSLYKKDRGWGRIDYQYSDEKLSAKRIARADNGELWIVNGVNRLTKLIIDQDHKVISEMDNPANRDGVADVAIHTPKSIWAISTTPVTSPKSGGMQLLDAKQDFKILHYGVDKQEPKKFSWNEGVSGGGVAIAIENDEAGTPWVVTSKGLVYRYDAKQNKWQGIQVRAGHLAMDIVSGSKEHEMYILDHAGHIYQATPSGTGSGWITKDIYIHGGEKPTKGSRLALVTKEEAPHFWIVSPSGEVSYLEQSEGQEKWIAIK